MKPAIKNSCCSGFTIIELVVVVVMIGVLAATALPRLSGGGSGFDERGFRDRTLAALRFAQKSAIAARRAVCTTFSTTVTPHEVSFRISSAFGAADCTTGTSLTLPDGSSRLVASGGVMFSAAPASIIFDANGRTAAATVSITNLPASLAIHVEEETGYVH